ncbi:MAG: glycosyltransferase [Candidatus Liptonbacteria bacterium]|nr:glycosyltransferase [Candidatus Liptonbacteria bacterium]
MAKPLVSIIIPSYNTARFIKEAVDSALAQTYKQIEIIVVDDGSTDDTRQILEQYIGQNSRQNQSQSQKQNPEQKQEQNPRQNSIIYIYQTNKGLAGARNTGIRASRGEYIALLDADDIFLPEKIEHQISYLTSHPNCDISYCDLHHFWDEETNKLFKLQYQYYSGAEVLPHLLEKNFIAPLSVVVRRSTFDRYGLFNESLRRSEDLEFWLRLSYAGAQFCFLPEILGKLRMRRTANLQGIESQPMVKLTMLQVLKMLNDKMTEKDRNTYKMQHHIRTYKLRLGLAYILIGKKSEAKKYIIESIGKSGWLPFAILPAGLAKLCVLKGYDLLRALRLKKL